MLGSPGREKNSPPAVVHIAGMKRHEVVRLLFAGQNVLARLQSRIIIILGARQAVEAAAFLRVCGSGAGSGSLAPGLRTAEAALGLDCDPAQQLGRPTHLLSTTASAIPRWSGTLDN